jgi:cytochrome c oxidase cbb3-type subunit 3
MQAFGNVLARADAEAVIDYVLYAFVRHKLANTRYHTPENGWPDHERYRDAYPFALGTLALDTPEDELTPAQRRGKRLFVSSCIVCHDRARLNDDRTLWEPRAVSYPRGGYSHRGAIDAESGATPYARHDHAPALTAATAAERRGEAIFQQNCAFCHAADGTGGNWIGRFLEPAPRDLTSPAFRAAITAQRLRRSIAEGVQGSAMPAWKTVLDEGQIEDVAAYVEKAFIGGTAGDGRRLR